METNSIPWERQVNETPFAWEAFVAYRDMGPGRSIAKAARSLGKSNPLLEEWSRNNQWVARCAAWDADCDRSHRQDMRDAQRAMVEAHADIARQLRTKAMEAFDLIEAERLSPLGVLEYLKAAVKIEQTTLGLPTERTAVELSATQAREPYEDYLASLPEKELISMAEQTLDELKKKDSHAARAKRVPKGKKSNGRTPGAT